MKKSRYVQAVSTYTPPPRDEKKEYKEEYEFAGRHGDKGRTGRVSREDKQYAKEEYCYYTQKEKDMLCGKPHTFKGVRKGNTYSRKK